jgi:hypothetical protein
MVGQGDDRPSRQVRKTARFEAEARALGQRVRSLREQRGWTLEHAAERMLLDLKPLVTLVRIADGAGVTVRDLFGVTGRRRRMLPK